MIRAERSVPPPAANPTVMVTDLPLNEIGCADAAEPASSAAQIKTRRKFIGPSTVHAQSDHEGSAGDMQYCRATAGATGGRKDPPRRAFPRGIPQSERPQLAPGPLDGEGGAGSPP